VEIPRKRNLLLVFAFSIVAFGVMGYHPGAEDDIIYLTAVKADLNPTLYPYDSDFFKLQVKTSTFDTWMAAFVRGSHIPLAWAELLWQFISAFLIVLACWSIVSQLFAEDSARWAGVAMVVAMFTLPVAGTALYIVDQYMHPRNLATGLILLAIASIIARKFWQAIPLVLVAFVLHPLMGAFGVSFCCVLALTLYEPLHLRLRNLRERAIAEPVAPVFAVVPFGWIFAPPSKTWLKAMQTRHLYQLYQWTWYEWLGAIGPIVLFWFIARAARKRGQIKLARVATAVLIYSVFQQLLAMVILSPAAPIGFSTLEPMRYLQLVYIFLTLIGGAYLGKYILEAKVWRWAVFLLLANGGMFIAQRQLFAATEHIELPGRASSNQWLQAFDWIRCNTPTNAYFAVDPNYMAASGEDYHSFRALSERSVLADALKDTASVTKEPSLGPAWDQQVASQAGWPAYKLADFERLKTQFGVNWVLVNYPQTPGLLCAWHNSTLAACQVP
jgi:hypothetical protein